MHSQDTPYNPTGSVGPHHDSPFDAMVLHRNGIVVETNDVFASLFGYAPWEADGMPVTDLVSPEDAELVEFVVCRSQVRRPLAILAVRKDRSTFHAELANTVTETTGGVIPLYFRDITIRKRAENRYQALFNRAPVMYVISHPTGDGPVIETCNDRFARRLGYRREELVGRPLMAVYTPESAAALMERGGYQRALEDNFTVEERDLKCRDGTVINTLLHAIPEQRSDGTVVGTRAMFIDISERKRAEEALKQAKETLELQNRRLNSLYQVGQIVNSTLEPDTVLDRLTDEAMRITRATHGQVLVVHRERGVFERRSLRGFSAREIRLARTLLLPLHDGVNGCVYNSQQPLRVDDVRETPIYFPLIKGTRSELAVPIVRDGEVLGNLDLQSPEPAAFVDVDLHYLNALADQTAIALTNARLYHAEEQSRRDWEATFNVMLDALVLVGREGTIINANPAFLKLIDPQHRPVVGASFREVVDRLQSPQIASMVEQTRQDEEPIFHTYEVDERIFAVQTIPVFSGMPNVLRTVEHVVLAMRDITEREQAQQQLKAFADRLEQSNRELEDFASVASHDLREPLRKIRVFGERLRQAWVGEALNEKEQDYLRRMLNSAERMQALIDGLMAYARVTTQAQPFQPVDLTELVQEVLADLEIRIEQSRGRVVVGNLPTVEADPPQMRQLLQNLIGNALKYHQAGRPPVVRVYGSLREGKMAQAQGALMWCHQAELVIEDNGIGFDEKHVNRIFAPFQRLHGRKKYEGTGMGLAVCRKIVERHGGEIRARSQPGQGTTFTVILPSKQVLDGRGGPP